MLPQAPYGIIILVKRKNVNQSSGGASAENIKTTASMNLLQRKHVVYNFYSRDNKVSHIRIR